MAEQVDFVVAGLGALGSAAAWQLARRGHRVVGLERFELGHSRGASHDTSRILRHSYHTPAYVRLTQEAYADWALLEAESRESLVTRVGGLDLFPPDPAIPLVDYTASLSDVGIAHELLEAAEVTRRWPQFRLPDGTVALHQADAAIVPAARGTRAMQDLARRHGADLRELSPVAGVRVVGDGVEVTTPHGVLRARGLVVCADAWVNDVLGHLGTSIPLEVTLEQVTYFRPERPVDFDPAVLPLWIWMDDPCYYGFPTYGEPTVKAAQDCGGPAVDPDHRTSEVDPAMQARLAAHLADILPGSGPPVRSLRCQYTLTPDRDFVLAPLPDHPQVVVGLGAAHAFKFAPTFGRLLADLAADGSTPSDVAAFRIDRPGLADPDYAAHWLV
ncbi:N-methyl-L-tryptophan oxidase [Nocardioides euryhalodurans]|uniref:N-methyl-L-tryptophan oxidase n=1 Tax=Nocardioides euryhalodurans TaxID=2518370 RepID=A0A4P7GKG0_9ACTN|nr:N-methyl-L-tryptophan oxidase [Nocardioides euryhalodurans]QBR92413.1 N-methyl-L-tryptophan oxidase [Nocardioides euryhalodurans]